MHLSIPPDERTLLFPLLWEKPRSHSQPQAERSETVSASVSDEEVLARLQAGDSTALGLLFERYARIVLGIALRIVHDSGEAEDIARVV
jgi:RNA polymerase sigma-70 factor, ECF subfamily